MADSVKTVPELVGESLREVGELWLAFGLLGAITGESKASSNATWAVFLTGVALVVAGVAVERARKKQAAPVVVGAVAIAFIFFLVWLGPWPPWAAQPPAAPIAQPTQTGLSLGEPLDASMHDSGVLSGTPSAPDTRDTRTRDAG